MIEGRNTGFPNAIQALQKNGSPLLSFEMNPDRDYLSVTIPIHPIFSSASSNGKRKAYESKIISALSGKESTLTELARSMGYKGITAKMRNTVESLIKSGKIQRKVSPEGSIMYYVTSDRP